MPIYEYVCIDCKEKTEVRATFSEKEKGLKVTCSKCGSKKMAQVFGSFMIKDSSHDKNSSPSCGPQCGPGCCG
jgi:putative FmdB family regulatory protein